MEELQLRWMAVVHVAVLRASLANNAKLVRNLAQEYPSTLNINLPKKFIVPEIVHCEDYVCLNGGTPVLDNGCCTCICCDGHRGDHCEIREF